MIHALAASDTVEDDVLFALPVCGNQEAMGRPINRRRCSQTTAPPSRCTTG